MHISHSLCEYTKLYVGKNSLLAALLQSHVKKVKLDLLSVFFLLLADLNKKNLKSWCLIGSVFEQKSNLIHSNNCLIS